MRRNFLALRSHELLAAALMLCATACINEAGYFRCTRDSECVKGSTRGLCEASGFCSFPDTSCMTGSRYGLHAPSTYANHCVGARSGGDPAVGGDPGSGGGDPAIGGDPGSAGGDPAVGGDPGSAGGDPAMGGDPGSGGGDPGSTVTPLDPTGANSFHEPFTWQGSHASIINSGAATTVWWSPDNWDVRGRTTYLPTNGNHPFWADIHKSTADPTDGLAIDDTYALGGDGSPGVGIMHMQGYGTMDARLRNPGLIAAGTPLSVDFYANAVTTSYHWWEVSLTPDSEVVAGDHTALAGYSLNNPQDSINVALVGDSAYPCGPPVDWNVNLEVRQASGGTVTRVQQSASLSPDPATELNTLWHWQLDFYPSQVVAFVDTDGTGLKYLQTFTINQPTWTKAYVHLLGIANNASDTAPSDAACGNYFTDVRELAWKDLYVKPVLYTRTVVLPEQNGTERTAQTLGWQAYDLRDLAHTGTVNSIQQPNAGAYNQATTLLFCSDASVNECNTAVSSKTLSLDLTSSDVISIARAQLVYDVRGDGTPTLSVGTTTPTVVGAMDNATTVAGVATDEWVHRSIDITPSLLVSGSNSFTIDMTGNVQMDRFELELDY